MGYVPWLPSLATLQLWRNHGITQITMSLLVRFANKPETWQAHGGMCMFQSTWDVTRRANDGPNPKTH